MSAECITCGADLVYGEWPEMHCDRCDWKKRAEIAEAKNAVLQAENEVLRGHIDRRHGGET